MSSKQPHPIGTAEAFPPLDPIRLGRTGVITRFRRVPLWRRVLRALGLPSSRSARRRSRRMA